MKHKNLMVVGTSSGAGKSIVVTGLCRSFYRKGIRVAPFKSQNMALNSFVTKNGKEIGRAQGLQSIACGMEALEIMNPILLKPTGEGRIQVIVNGKSIGNMNSLEYRDYKKELKKIIIEDYKKIKEISDISFIEGAGSPVEINMNDDDIVNMGVAEMVDAPVILVADIDRGGVFASIYGTLELMKPEERKRVKGVIINKFRGDISILKDGLDKIEKIAKTKILGVLPYFKLDIEDEDGISERFNRLERGKIEIGVIKLKHISNFTDILSLSLLEDVTINYIDRVENFGNPDMIIIPGSKNTIDDLNELKNNGLAKEIIKSAKEGVIIFGICGGFQILGDNVKDIYGIEGEIMEAVGLGLLDIETIMERDKKTTQFKGKFGNIEGIFKELSNVEIEGYEIHQGVTRVRGKEEAINVYGDKNIFGTYIHGIFDNKNVLQIVSNILRDRKGLDKITIKNGYEQYREEQLDKLADIIEKNIDMKKIEKILELGNEYND